MVTIGRLAKHFHVTIDTLRHYEREGLVAPEAKTESGYRLYGENTLRRMNFIKHAQQCGFTLAEIRQFVMLKNCDTASCRDVRKLAVEKKRQLDARIQSLTIMSEALGKLTSMCVEEDKPLDECPFLAALESVDHAAGAADTNASAD